MNEEILILSPHLDDAVLSCCNHIRLWQGQGHHVRVLTLFNAYEGGYITPSQKKVMKENHILNLNDYEKIRKLEDENAMNALNVSSDYLNLLDAGFRQSKGKALYLSYKELTSELDYDQESNFIKTIVNKLKECQGNFEIILPLSVGHHVDHQLTRICGETVFAENNIHYYVDFPYARNPLKWKYSQFIKLLTYKRSIQFMDNKKREILDFYKTQVKYFFKYPPVYPEIILSERKVEKS